jgi:hypothetical protein
MQLWRGELIPATPAQRVIYKEFKDTQLEYGHEHNVTIVSIAIVTCYHAFTGNEEYYDEHVFKEKYTEFYFKETKRRYLR